MSRRLRKISDTWRMTIIDEHVVGPFFAKAENLAGEEWIGSGMSREEAMANVTQQLKALYGEDVKISKG